MIIIYNLILLVLFLITFPGSYFIFFYYIKNSGNEFPNKKYLYWIHCASLGEVKIALKLVDKIVKRTKVSKEDILLTVTNSKTKNITKKIHKEVYVFPIDFFLITKKFLKIVNPKVLLILETELWPNYIYYTKKFGAKIFLLNGRMSRKTLILLTMFKSLFKIVFDNIDYITVREKIDLNRFQKIFSKDKIIVVGNMKYDDIEDFSYNITKKDFGFNETDFVLTFGSIRNGEEKFVFETIEKLKIENIKFIIAPRHIKNVPKIVKMLQRNKIKFVKRTELISNKKFNFDINDIQCILVDTLGELKKFYFISNVIFVGGTILPYGGQSIIEPATLGKVVVFGSYIENFLEVSILLKKNGACYTITTAAQLAEIVLYLKKNEKIRNEIGKKAKEVIKSLTGATEKNVDFILQHL